MPDREIVMYGIPNCDQVRKARAWLADHAIAYRFYDFKKSGADAHLISEWQDAIGWEQLLNRKGTTWRGLSDEDKTAVTDAPSAAAMMSLHPSLIKRPVLRLPDRVHAGFADTDYQNIFKV